MAQTWLTFDCFGTLVDWNSGLTNLLKPVFGARTSDIVSSYHRYERQFERDKPHRLYRDAIVRSLSAAAEECSLSLDWDQANDIVASWHSLPKFADTELMLSQLRAAGFKIGVLTNCDEDLFARTAQSFDHPFDLVVTAESVRDYKPAVEHFRAFAERTGVDSKCWVHVANSWFHDIAPAQKFGIRSIWLDRDRTGQDPSIALAHVKAASDVPRAVHQILSV